MKKVKKFNEMFDSEDLYSKGELDYISGDIKQDIKDKISNDEIIIFDEIPKMHKLLKSLVYNFPFILNATMIGGKKDETSILVEFSSDNKNGFMFEVSINNDDTYNIEHGIIEDEQLISRDEKRLTRLEMIRFIEKDIYPNFKKVVDNFKSQNINILEPGTDIDNFRPEFNSVFHSYDDYKLIK